LSRKARLTDPIEVLLRILRVVIAKCKAKRLTVDLQHYVRLELFEALETLPVKIVSAPDATESP
jgi:hypothetical protein